MQQITKKGHFHAGHRLVGHKGGCGSLHGHTYHYELTFQFSAVDEMGYAVDFADLRKIFMCWIDEQFDHAFILNPKDPLWSTIVDDSKTYIMYLNGATEFCNPSCENIAKEIFLGCRFLHDKLLPKVDLVNVRLYETPNSYTDCGVGGPGHMEAGNYLRLNQTRLVKYCERYVQAKQSKTTGDE